MSTIEDSRGLPAIEARGISKAFDGRLANDDVCFRAFSGEIHAVLGENGAGKSTLVSMLCGVYRPDAGDVHIDGKRVNLRSPRDALNAGVGVVYQDLRLIENLTVLENVLLGAGARPSPQARDRVRTLSSRAGFDLPLNALVRTLGIGHRQQIEILKLLARNLRILIFDEPTAVLGEAQVGELFATMTALKRQRKAIVLITHRLREVRAIADRLTILRNGRVKASDRKPEEFTDSQLAELIVGSGVTPARAEFARPIATAPRRAVLALHDVFVPSTSGSGLRGVSMEVHTGEIVGVAGVRGNGQREAAEVAAGLITPSQGSVERSSAEVGFIPEDRLGMGLARAMTVAENLTLRRYREPPLGRPVHLDVGAMRAFAATLIGRYDIPAAPGWVVTRLSGGGLQRVVVARELERNTPLVVAAQPTRGLDIRSADFVRQQLVNAATRGAGVLVISEELDELISLSDRIFVLYEGAVAAVVERASFERHQLGAMMVGGRDKGMRNAEIAT